MILGAHTSIAGGLHRALERGRELGCETVAIFSRNQRQWRVPPLAPEAVAAWREALERLGYDAAAVLCHDSYLINLGHPEREPWERSRAAFLAEVDRCDALGIRHLVFHPGAHLGGLSERGCCERVAEALRWTLDARPDSQVVLCVENTAGQGTTIGHRVEHLARILERTDAPGRVGVCFDTCHAFAAGYDLRLEPDYEATLRSWDDAVGLDRIRGVHLNDAQRPLGSRVDRHANIGFGELGEAVFRRLVNDPRFAHCPACVETPVKTHGGHAGDLQRLRSHRARPNTQPASSQSPDGGDKRDPGRYRAARTKPHRNEKSRAGRQRGATATGHRTMDQATLKPALLELIRRASTDLPPDVEDALHRARRREAKGSGARAALDAIAQNIDMARAQSTPICQDTGTNLYFIQAPLDLPEPTLSKAILAATRQATRKGWLRPNVVDPVTGRNTGDNIGLQNPQIHLHQHRKKSLRVDLMLKGGGCENVSTQYTLPDGALGAGRDLAGVERCIVDSAHQAQGKGCAPGIFGVGVGGDRLSSYAVAKEQLLRPLTDENPDPALARLERRCHRTINQLGIGPMGFGGKTTSLGVKVGIAHRLPASYYVSIAYMCWACRRWTLVLRTDGRYRLQTADGTKARR